MSPAGSFESLKSAICGGANAVYLGLPRFNARQKAENFNYENFPSIVTYCHLRKVKIYVAINTIIKENEIDDCLCDVNFVIANRADGIIVQDLFLAKIIHEHAPKFPIHLSTQCGICSFEGAKLAKELGATRVVLARETSLDEIERISKNLDIEIEYFVQGALCVSYSGNCYFSSIIDGNSGNRGRCAQPCRKKMKLVCDDFSVEGYNLSPKDLSFYKQFKKLIDVGVTSFKIEGRLRSPEYVFFATSIFSKLANGEEIDQATFDKLLTSFNRGDYSDGYLFGRKSKVIYNKIQSNIGLEVGKIIKATDKKIIVDSKFTPQINDGFKITRENCEIGGGVFLKGCQSANNYFELFAKNCKIGDVVRLTASNENKKLVENLSDKVNIQIDYKIKLNETIKVTAKLNGLTHSYETDYCPQEAKTSALTKTELETQLLKLNDTQFICDEIQGELDDNVFLAKSQMNALRRETIDGLLSKFVENDSKLFAKCIVTRPKTEVLRNNQKLNCVIVNELNYSMDFINGFNIVVFKPFEYSIENINAFKVLPTQEKYLYVPNYLSTEDIEKLDRLLDESQFDGIYSDGYNGVEIAKRHKLSVFLGANCNITNSLIEQSEFVGQKYYSLSKELNQNELNQFDSNAFVLVFGGFVVMNFVHCPLINAGICGCNDCKFKDVKYIDENNREFQVVKTKIDGCLFSMLNNVNINITENVNQNAIFDLSFYDENKTAGLLESNPASSKGHFNRGVK